MGCKPWFKQLAVAARALELLPSAFIKKQGTSRDRKQEQHARGGTKLGWKVVPLVPKGSIGGAMGKIKGNGLTLSPLKRFEQQSC